MKANEDYPDIYLIPGQGADYRLFNNLELNKKYELRHVQYHTPKKGSTLKEFAIELSAQIQTQRKFILIGVSLGGMLATEMSEFLSPEKTIIISSAKSRNELPLRYRFQKKIPLYKLLSSKMTKKGALFMQPIVEPDRNKERETFIKMLEAKDPDFLKRTIEMIVNWEIESSPKNIIHIHGDKDKTIPIRNINLDYTIKGGSHMMTLTRGKEISKLLNDILE